MKTTSPDDRQLDGEIYAIRYFFTALTTLSLAVCSSAWSAEVVSDDVRPAAAAMDENPGAVKLAPALSVVPTNVPGFGAPMASRPLDGHRGGFDLVKNDMQLNGSVADNSARYFTTGGNYIADGSFSSMSGIPMVIQNSGANVLIQNATIFNLQLQ